VIQIVALAVAETPGADFGALECAITDAERVYSCIAHIGGHLFDGMRSYVSVNPSASQARELLLLAAAAAGKDDLLAVYISSHGVLHKGSLCIPFNDARPNNFGFLESEEIAAMLRRCAGHVLLVIDSCFSGAALAETHLRDIYATPNLSVIASALPYARANYDPIGSDFTLAFVRAMERISGTGEAVAVSRIAACIVDDRQYGGDVLVNLAEGLSDLLVAPPPGWYQSVADRSDFEILFLDRTAASPAGVREMLWYNLDGMPDGLKLKMFRQFRERHMLGEPSWLVRRAMGTVLSRIDDVQARKRIDILEFLTAKNWMHVCVGLVAARNSLGDAAIRSRVREVLIASQYMDAVWLANLYLADYSSEYLSDALSSALGRSSWGLVDLWKRFSNEYDDPERLARLFRDSKLDNPNILRDLRTHLECAGNDAGASLGVEPDRRVVTNELVRFQYARKPRGVIAQSAVKWLVSSLYGGWRDVLTGDLREYLDNTEVSQIISDVEVCRSIPSVEHRVSICQDLALLAADEPTVRHAAIWAVTDPHPWVRRESLRLFPGDRQIAERALDVTTDRGIFPGYLDLILEAYRHGADVEGHIQTPTKVERSAINWAISVEAVATDYRSFARITQDDATATVPHQRSAEHSPLGGA